MMTKMLNVLYHIEPLYRLTPAFKAEKEILHEGVLKIADEIYEEKMKSGAVEIEAESEFEDGFNPKSRNFINTLINPKNALSEQEIKDEINTLVAAVRQITCAQFVIKLIFLLRDTRHRRWSSQTPC
jgi:hypothetical protein